MSDTPWKREGIRRLDGADKNGIAEAEALVRLAKLGQYELDWREIGSNALTSGIAGAGFGSLAGGVGAIPGGIYGALSGAAVQPLTEAAEEALYWWKKPSDKAFAQAKELNKSVQEMGDIVASYDAQLGSFIKAQGNQYTEYISAYIAGNQVNAIEKNIYNRPYEEIQKQFNQNMSEVRYPTAQKSGKNFIRLANENTKSVNQVIEQGKSPKNSNVLEDVNDTVPFFPLVSQGVSQQAVESALAQAMRKIADPKMLKLLLNWKSASVDFVLGMGLGLFQSMQDRARAALVRYEEEIPNVKYAIEQINKLTNSDPKVVAAGNSVYSWILEGLDTVKTAPAALEKLRAEMQKK